MNDWLVNLQSEGSQIVQRGEPMFHTQRQGVTQEVAPLVGQASRPADT